MRPAVEFRERRLPDAPDCTLISQRPVIPLNCFHRSSPKPSDTARLSNSVRTYYEGSCWQTRADAAREQSVPAGRPRLPEATALTEGGYQVTVIAPALSGQPRHEVLNDVRIYRFPPPPAANGVLGYLWEYVYSMAAAFIISLTHFRATRVRRRARAQPTGHVRVHRSVLQAVRRAFRVRPPRPLTGDVPCAVPGQAAIG